MKAIIRHKGRNTAVDVSTIDEALEKVIPNLLNEGDKALVYGLDGERFFTVERREGAKHWNHPNYFFNSGHREGSEAILCNY